MLGLCREVCAKDDWYYLLLYDIDKEELSQSDLEYIDTIMFTHKISYLIYKTKHGYHVIGLTPLNITNHADAFYLLKNYFKSYYSGKTIRLSRKQDETQALIKLELSYGEVIPNLYNLYCSRFNMEKMPWTRETAKYLLLFEKYRSDKQ